jgi:hypothetical protein
MVANKSGKQAVNWMMEEVVSWFEYNIGPEDRYWS